MFLFACQKNVSFNNIEKAFLAAYNVGDTLIYRGEAAPGADESASVWRIKRIQFAPDGDVTETWADGVAEFAYVWTDRTSLTYL